MQGTAQAKRTSAFTMFDTDVGRKTPQSCMEHTARPPGRGNASVHGPGGTCSGRSESFGEGLGPAGAPSSPPLQPIPHASRPAPRPGEAIRVLPLGDPVHRSPSSQYPAPAGSDWASNAGSRRGLGPGLQTGPQALTAPPAQLPVAWRLMLTRSVIHSVPEQSGARPSAGRAARGACR